MKILHSISSLVLCVGIVCVAETPKTAEKPQQWQFNKVAFEVRDVDGKPAPDVPVRLLGLDRDALFMSDDDGGNSTKYPAWNFVTDAQGRFTATFGDFRSRDYDEELSFPGSGCFYLVAKKQDASGRMLGGVSPIIYNLYVKCAQDLADWPSPQKQDIEWQTGEYAVVSLQFRPDDAPPVVIPLRRGIAVTGTVHDTKGCPVAGANVQVYNDLHCWSHSGYGGEIFRTSGTTDKQGRYRIENVYPNRFFTGFPLRPQDACATVPCSRNIFSDSEVDLYWYKARLRNGKWKEQMIDDIMPQKKEKEIQLDFIVSREPLYRYSGRVTDKEGKSVADAEVTLGVSRHQTMHTYFDNHHYESTKTDADGKYDMKASTRFCRGFGVKASGFEDLWKESDEGRPFPPGSYDFQLKGIPKNPSTPSIPSSPSESGNAIIGSPEIPENADLDLHAFSSEPLLWSGWLKHSSGISIILDIASQPSEPPLVIKPRWPARSQMIFVPLGEEQFGKSSPDGKWSVVGRRIDKEVGTKQGFCDWAFRNWRHGSSYNADGTRFDKNRPISEDETGPSDVVPHWSSDSRFVVVNLPMGSGRFLHECAIFRMDENKATSCPAPWDDPPAFFAAMVKEADAKRVSGQYKRFVVACDGWVSVRIFDVEYKWVSATDFEIEYSGQVHLDATEKEPEEWVSLDATATIRMGENGDAQIIRVKHTRYEKDSATMDNTR